MSAPPIYPRAQPPPLDPSERAQLRRELERELERGSGLRGRALQLADALRRLENGTYGRCAACGSGISFERLSAIPETTVCAECSWSREVTYRGGNGATT